MATIRITKTSTEVSPAETFVMESNVFESLRIGLNTPMFVQDLPQTTEEETIIIKVTGNTQRINYIFKLVDLGSTNLVTSGLASGIDTSTIDGQMGFLLNEFRPTGIEDSYLFEIINPNLLSRECVMENLQINFDDDPINPICIMTFVVGDVQSPLDEGVPQKQATNLAVVDSGGNPSISWTNVSSTDQGSAGAITGYKIERRSQIGSWEVVSASTSTPYSDTTASDTTGVIYKYRVSAINPAGAGRVTQPVSHTRP